MQYLCARALFKNLCVAVFRFSETARHSSLSWATLNCRMKVRSEFFPSRTTTISKNSNLYAQNIEDRGTSRILIKFLQKFNKHIWEKQCWGGVSAKKNKISQDAGSQFSLCYHFISNCSLCNELFSCLNWTWSDILQCVNLF